MSMAELQIGAGDNQQPASRLRQTGRCTRCGKALKSIFVVNGAQYGPVCVRKTFGVVVYTGGRPARKHVQILPPSDQLSFIELFHVVPQGD